MKHSLPMALAISAMLAVAAFPVSQARAAEPSGQLKAAAVFSQCQSKIKSAQPALNAELTASRKALLQAADAVMKNASASELEKYDAAILLHVQGINPVLDTIGYSETALDRLVVVERDYNILLACDRFVDSDNVQATTWHVKHVVHNVDVTLDVRLRKLADESSNADEFWKGLEPFAQSNILTMSGYATEKIKLAKQHMANLPPAPKQQAGAAGSSVNSADRLKIQKALVNGFATAPGFQAARSAGLLERTSSKMTINSMSQTTVYTFTVKEGASCKAVNATQRTCAYDFMINYDNKFFGTAAPTVNSGWVHRSDTFTVKDDVYYSAALEAMLVKVATPAPSANSYSSADERFKKQHKCQQDAAILKIPAFC